MCVSHDYHHQWKLELYASLHEFTRFVILPLQVEDYRVNSGCNKLVGERIVEYLSTDFPAVWFSRYSYSNNAGFGSEKKNVQLCSVPTLTVKPTFKFEPRSGS